MRQFLPPLRLVNAEVLRDGALQQRSVALQDGRITKGPLPEVDLSGYLVLPGIIDLEGQAISASDGRPRPDWSAVDQTASAQGVTTTFVRGDITWASAPDAPERALGTVEALERVQPGLGTDIRCMYHVETHMMEHAQALRDLAEHDLVQFVFFANRLTQALARIEADHGELLRCAAQTGEAPDALRARLRALSKASKDVPRFLCGLAEFFDQTGVLYGSQGDPDGETREFYSMIGARICLRPVVRSAASLARAVGDPVLLAAGELVRPEEGSGEYSVADMIARGTCDGLVSHGSAGDLAAAAFYLRDRLDLPLAKAWALISSAPAEIARMTDRGRIDYGARADLAIVSASTRRVEATICNGRLTYLTGEAANRFLGQPAGFGHAAE